MANSYDKQLEGVGDLSPKDLRDARAAFIAGQTDMSDKSAVEMAIALEHKRLEDYAKQQAKSDKATGATNTDWLGTWLDSEKEKARQKILARFERESKEKAAAETAQKAVDAFDKPLYLKVKHRL